MYMSLKLQSNYSSKLNTNAVISLVILLAMISLIPIVFVFGSQQTSAYKETGYVRNYNLYKWMISNSLKVSEGSCWFP